MKKEKKPENEGKNKEGEDKKNRQGQNTKGIGISASILKTVLILVFIPETLQAETKITFRTVSKTDNIALKLIGESQSASQMNTNPEEYIQYKTTDPQISQKNDNFNLVANLGNYSCSMMKSFSPNAEMDNLYLLCNSSEILVYTRNKSQKNPGSDIYRFNATSKLKKSDKFLLQTCLNFVIYKEVVSSNITIQALFKVLDKVSSVTSYLLIPVGVGKEIDIGNPSNSFNLTIDSKYPIEPSFDFSSDMVKLKKKDGNVVDVQSLLIYRKPSLKNINDQAQFNNGYIWIYNLVDKTVSVFNLQQGNLNLKVITDVFLMDSKTFLVTGYKNNNAFLTTFKIVKKDAEFTFASMKEFKVPEDVKKGFGMVHRINYQNNNTNKLIGLYSDFEKKLHGICQVDFSNDKGYLGKCKYEQSLQNSIASKGLGCLNENQCYFAFNSETDFNLMTGYSLFSKNNTSAFSSNFKIFFKASLIGLDSSKNVIGVNKQNWIKSFTMKKITIFQIDGSKLTQSPQTLSIEKKVYDPVKKNTTSMVYKIEIHSIDSLFLDFTIPPMIPKVYGYLGNFFEVDTNAKSFSGNALEFMTEGTGFNSVVMGTNNVNFTFEKKYSKFDKANTRIIPFKQKVFRYAKGKDLEFFNCKTKEANVISYNCTFFQQIKTASSESLFDVYNVDDFTNLIVKGFDNQYKSKVIFVTQNLIKQSLLEFKITSFKALKIGSSLHLIMITSQLDQTKTERMFISRVRFENFDMNGKDLKMTNIFQIPLSSLGPNLNCIKNLNISPSGNKINAINNCGDFSDSFISADIDGTGKLSNISRLRFYDQMFSSTKKQMLKYCLKGDQLLLAEINTDKIKMTRIGLLEFSEDLGIKELNVTKIVDIFCPGSSNKFVVLAEVKPRVSTNNTKMKTYKMIIYTWGAFNDANNRITSKTKEIPMLKNPLISFQHNQFSLSYFEEKILQTGTSDFTTKTIIISELRPRVMINSTKATLNDSFLVVSGLNSTKKVPVLGEFVVYNDTLQFTTQGVPYIQEKTYKMDDLVKIQGPIMDIDLLGDQFLTSNVEVIHRIRFIKDFEDFKIRRRGLMSDFIQALPSNGDSRFKRSLMSDTGLLQQTFNVFKKMKEKKSIMSGLLDINQKSIVFLYNNTRKLEKRVDYTTSCFEMDFDIEKKSEDLVIATICNDPLNPSQKRINLKVTNLDGFKPNVISTFSKNLFLGDKIEVWFGKNIDDIVLAVWVQQESKLMFMRVDLTKRTQVKGKEIFEVDFNKIWELTNSK